MLIMEVVLEKDTLGLQASEQVRHAMASSYHNGLIARATRSIIQCLNIKDIAVVVEDTMRALQLSGCSRITDLTCRKDFWFGSGLKSNQLSNLACFSNKKEKITIAEDCIIYNEENIILIVMCGDDTEDRKGILQDSLAIFIDTIQSWLSQYIVHSQEALSQQQKRISVIDNMNEIINCLDTLNEHLIECHNHVAEELSCDLISKFTLLGLDDDQEESIIDITNNAMNEQKGLFEIQRQQNDELQAVVRQAVGVLIAQPEPVSKVECSGGVSGIEIF